MFVYLKVHLLICLLPLSAIKAFSMMLPVVKRSIVFEDSRKGSRLSPRVLYKLPLSPIKAFALYHARNIRYVVLSTLTSHWCVKSMNKTFFPFVRIYCSKNTHFTIQRSAETSYSRTV